MRFPTYIIASLVALAIVASIPGLSLGRKINLFRCRAVPKIHHFLSSKEGVGTVVQVDQPDNCLRIRSGPGNSYDVIGCAPMGAQLNLYRCLEFKRMGATCGEGMGLRTAD